MKSATRNILTFLAPMAFLAIGSIAYAGTPTATTYTADDLFIGFHSAGSTSDYLVKIGQASTFTTTRTLSIGSIALDLTAVFGSGWASDSTLKWGVIGTTRLSTVGSDPAHTIYASRQGNASTATPWNTGSINYLTTADAKIASMASAYISKTSTANSTVGLIQNNIGTAANTAYASYQTGGANATGAAANLSFALFTPSIEASSASGITDSSASLAVYRLAPGAVAPATAFGTFSINSSGTVTFTAATTSAFNTWASAHSLSGANALPAATPANDGIQNMVKFALGVTNPSSGVAQNTPTAVISGSNYVFSFPFNSDSTAEYTTAVQYSTDLATWTPASGSLSSPTSTYIIPLNGATKMFARLSVSPK